MYIIAYYVCSSAHWIQKTETNTSKLFRQFFAHCASINGAVISLTLHFCRHILANFFATVACVFFKISCWKVWRQTYAIVKMSVCNAARRKYSCTVCPPWRRPLRKDIHQLCIKSVTLLWFLKLFYILPPKIIKIHSCSLELERAKVDSVVSKHSRWRLLA